MKTQRRYGLPVAGAPDTGRDALILGAPWNSGDAVAICAELTGVVARVCHLEPGLLPEGAHRRVHESGLGSPPHPCQALALEGMRALPRTRDTPYRYLCPNGVPCACISLAHSPARCQAHIWVRPDQRELPD